MPTTNETPWAWLIGIAGIVFLFGLVSWIIAGRRCKHCGDSSLRPCKHEPRSECLSGDGPYRKPPATCPKCGQIVKENR